MSSLPFRIEKPTFIAAVAYLVLAFMVLLPLKIGTLDPQFEKTEKYNLGYRVLILFIMLIPICLSLYSINCMVAGHCTIWSYLNSLFIVLWVFLFVTAVLISRQRSI
jgi:hypothetical protein